MKIIQDTIHPPLAPSNHTISGALGELGSDLPLDWPTKLHAWLSAVGMKGKDIDEALGLPEGNSVTLITDYAYQEMAGRCRRLLAQRTVEAARNVDDLFNNQIGQSAATLIELRDDPRTKEGVRLKAATEFLDRATLAPKVRKEVDERKVIIALPVSELRNMQQALTESGTDEDREIFDLIEGKDYTEAEDVEIAVEHI